MHSYKLLPVGVEKSRKNVWRRVLVETNPLNSSLLAKCVLLVVLLLLLLAVSSLFVRRFYLLGEGGYFSEPIDGIHYAAGDIVDNGTLLAKFVDFQKRFSRNYSSVEEKLRRFSIFVTNFRHLDALGGGSPGGEGGKVFGVTAFFDWSDEELKELIMPFGPGPFAGVEPIREFHPANANYKRPKEFDWRKKGVISHVKNQLRCGACWAFATAAVVESQHAIRNGTLFTLSEQQMIDCDQSNDGCEGGNRPNAFRYVRDNGLLQEKAYPYRGGDGNCELSPGPVDPSHRVFVDELRTLPGDEGQIADFVVEKGPVSFGMNVTKGMFHYVGGIFSPTVDDCALHSLGRHALEVVGFGEDAKGGGTPFWILKNSWGSSWGINGGYVHVKRGVDACGLSQEVHTALITRY